ncbi:MAG: NAD(P)-dependent oxidoreductase [Capnocytophaga sp.]|nr:NAD(P)-dependent oxidoreductase [Capnocytophaga sp.]
MKAVFLDRNTFSENVELPKPEGVTDWVVFQKTTPDQVVERLQDADIAIINKIVLGKKHFEQLPKLKLIHLTATGTDNVDKIEAKNKNIEVKNVVGYSTNSVAEHFFALLLATMRGIKPQHQAVEDGSWQADGRFCLTEPPVFDLYGKTLGIIGIGNIGKAITERAKVFGMNVLWAERQGKTPRSQEYSHFDDVLAQSDIISLNCPLNEETKYLINAKTIAKMHKKPLIINVARGPVVESQAVYDAVMNGDILGFASDVFENEPPLENDPLLKICNHPRVVYTPHIAWASTDAQKRLWQILKQQTEDFIKHYK